MTPLVATLTACLTTATTVWVPPGADPEERLRRVDEALLVEAAGEAHGDVVLEARLVTSLRVADPDGTATLSDPQALALARALDLHHHDPLARLRLRELGAAAISRVPEPDEASLERWLAAHPDRFALPGRVTWAELFVAGDPPEAAERLRGWAAAAPSPEQAFAQGDPRLDRRVLRTTALDEPTLSPSLREALAHGATDAWSAPLRTPEGWRSVRVLGRTPTRRPALAEVHAAVRGDLLRHEGARRLAVALAGRRAAVVVREVP